MTTINKTIKSPTAPKSTKVLWDNGTDTYYNIIEDGNISLDTTKKSLLERIEALE